MDTDWCLRCGLHTIEGNDYYCSKQCMVLDQSLAHSLPTHTSYHRRASFDVPPLAISSPSRTESRAQIPSSLSPKYRQRTRPSDLTHNVSRFRDEELQDLHAGTYHVVPSQYSGKDYKGILRWAASVQPGLEEEEREQELIIPSSPASSSMPVDIDKLTRPPPFFPLTAQNLAPPCVTIDPRHISVVSVFQRHHHHHQHSQPPQRRTTAAPSLIQSQDDASFFTPASESVNTPSVVPDASCSSSAASSHAAVVAAAPLLGRFVNKLSSWISTPSRLPRPVIEVARPTASPHEQQQQEEELVHSDETLRVHIPSYQEKKTSMVPIPHSQNHTRRQKRSRLVTSGPPYEL